MTDSAVLQALLMVAESAFVGFVLLAACRSSDVLGLSVSRGAVEARTSIDGVPLANVAVLTAA